MTNLDHDTHAAPDADDLIAQLAAARGIDPAALRAQLDAAATAPLVADHIDAYLARLSKNTRRTYRTHLNRLRNGFGPICDAECESCLDPATGFRCRCDCRECRESRISLEAQGARTVGPGTYTEENVRLLSRAARLHAVKTGIVENQRRATRGLAQKPADGVNAEETAVQALRSLYRAALPYLGVQRPGEATPAHGVKKPRRPGRSRRPLLDFELLELQHITATGGDDPEVDELIFDYGVATGSRREGAYNQVVGRVYPGKQMVGMVDKYKVEREAPVSSELIGRLLEHARARGGAQCDPTSPRYRPNAPLFWFRDGSPLTSRRFDTLHRRWQLGLEWAREERVAYHHIRHSMAAFLKSLYGPQYAKRYLRHADGEVTDMYGVCTELELAAAMADLLGFEHPLAQGRAAQRAETLQRFGLPA